MNYKTNALYLLIITFIPIILSPAYAVEFDAVLDWNKKVTLSTPVSGMVSTVTVNTGDSVNKNDVLIKLDDRLLHANIDRFQSDVIHFRALLTEARKELERTLELYERQLLAMHDRDLANIKVAEAEADLKNAQADLKKAELDLEYSTLRAPFNAIILDLLINPNEAVVNNQQARPLVVLAERGKMQAIILADYEQLADLTPGKNVTVAINNDTYTGVIKHISFEPVSTTNKYEVRVLFNSGEKLLRAGQRARLLLP